MPPPKQCLGENELLRFLSGELSEEQAQRCKDHLASCPACSFVAADVADEAIPSGRVPERANVCTFSKDDVIGGRYRIVKFLAHGGMGEVYEAEDRDLGERIALKTIAASISDDPKAAARLKREVQIARWVTHPNVCRIFDLGHHRQLPETTFLTMELLRGETLGHRIRRAGGLPLAEGAEVARQVAAALDAAHTAGVIHRDLKSDNIMLLDRAANAGLKAVVMDFGLARPTAPVASLAGSMLNSAVAGTVSYMSPEQVEGGEITTASDIYSFGVVLFEVFTGLMPFEGASPLAVAAKRLNERPRSPLPFRPEMDPRWEAIILRCLEREPAARFTTAGDAVRTRVESPAWSGRRKVRAAVAAGTSVLAIATVGFLIGARPPILTGAPGVAAAPPPLASAASEPAAPPPAAAASPAPAPAPPVVVLTPRAPANPSPRARVIPRTAARRATSGASDARRSPTPPEPTRPRTEANDDSLIDPFVPVAPVPSLDPKSDKP